MGPSTLGGFGGRAARDDPLAACTGSWEPITV
jgi:hypothetical protein